MIPVRSRRGTFLKFSNLKDEFVFQGENKGEATGKNGACRQEGMLDRRPGTACQGPAAVFQAETLTRGIGKRRKLSGKGSDMIRI